jgi:outer membrane protein
MKAHLMAMAVGAAMLASGSAMADEGPWLIRLRALHMNVSNDAGTPLGDVSVNDKTFPEIDFTYFFTRNIAAELVLTYPQRHDVRLDGNKIGSLKHLPPVLSLQYHFLPDARFRPYVGAGINYTRFMSVDLPNVPGVGQLDVDNSSVGLSLQVGADVKLSDQLFLNVDVKKVQIDTDITANGNRVVTYDIDPLLVSVGLGYRF